MKKTMLEEREEAVGKYTGIKARRVPKLNRTARISKEALQELVRIGAIYKKHVDECLIKEGDLYINLFMFPDIYTFAYHKNSKIIMSHIYFKNIIKKTKCI